jgi:alanyl-tRNA synthetase
MFWNRNKHEDLKARISELEAENKQLSDKIDAATTLKDMAEESAQRSKIEAVQAMDSAKELELELSKLRETAKLVRKQTENDLILVSLRIVVQILGLSNQKYDMKRLKDEQAVLRQRYSALNVGSSSNPFREYFGGSGGPLSDIFSNMGL